MKILVTGGYGFIGSHCAAALAAAGHEVITGGRSRRTSATVHGHMAVDFMRDVDVQIWLHRLAGFDAVVNAVGAMVESRGQNMEKLHYAAPRAMFDACARLDIEAINISALGADDGASSKFHLTKKALDDHLLAAHPKALVLQPSLVYGAGGASARMFDLMASLPLVPLIGDGKQRIQPVHVDDVAALVAKIVGSGCCYGQKVPVVGPVAMNFREYLAELRAAMQLSPPRFVRVPRQLAGAVLELGARMHVAWASPDAIAMLNRGNTGPVDMMATLLGQLPRPAHQFIRPEYAECAARNAKWAWLSVLLRLAIAVVWLSAGVLSAGIYPIERSVALVEATGAGPALSTALVYLGAAVDVVFGIATLVMRRRSFLWLAQIACITAYTLIITLWLPEFWLHPFGPVVKNLPLIVAIYLMYEFERR